MTPEQYNALVEQHLQLLQQNSQQLTALVTLSIVGLLAMLVIAILAAWSVQTANRATHEQGKAVMDALGEIKGIVMLVAQSLGRRASD